MAVTLVGSRKAPKHMLDLAYQIGYQLALSGEAMYSGGALGMDETWELGYHKAGRTDLINVILPTTNFNKRKPNDSFYTFIGDYDIKLLEKADKLIQQVHDHYDKLNGFSYFAHIRNCFQVLGHDLESPSTETFLYAPISGSKVLGGTSTAYEISKLHGIPTHNLAHRETMLELHERFGIRPPTLDFLL